MNAVETLSHSQLMISAKGKAFTLVELLVVISTIGLLMAISIPVRVTSGALLQYHNIRLLIQTLQMRLPMRILT